MLEFYLIGYWQCFYPEAREYFWGGPFATNKEALAWGKNKQNNGQPEHLAHWSRGRNRIYPTIDAFNRAATRVGLSPDLNHTSTTG